VGVTELETWDACDGFAYDKLVPGRLRTVRYNFVKTGKFV